MKWCSNRPDTSNSFDWFSEKQTKVYRIIRTFLETNGTDKEPKSINQTRYMYKACMNTSMEIVYLMYWVFIQSLSNKLIVFLAHMDTLGLRPLLDYLTLVGLPEVPSILRNNTDYENKFDWVKTLASIKKVFSADVIFGFDIFPDPSNRTINRLVLGTPESSSVLPLWVWVTRSIWFILILD